jgi:hypothetical protein
MDTSTAPIGERRLKAILDHIVRCGDTVETDYLEAKSNIDLSTGLGLAKVAKFILGTANRTPAKAQRHFRGHAVMVLGAEACVAPGVATGCESHELADKLAKYLGRQGPTFELARVPVSHEREVLFVIVDPPESGQPGFPCHRDFNPDDKSDTKNALRNGALYIRAASSTRVARAVEVEALFLRSISDISKNVDLTIEIVSKPTRVSGTDEFLDNAIAWAAGEYRTRASKTTTTSPAWSLSAVKSIPNRSPEQIQAQIDIFEADARRRWPHQLEYLLGCAVDGLGISITNKVGSWLSKPRIDLTFHGCYGVAWRDRRYMDLDEVTPLIDPPRTPFDYLHSTFRSDLRVHQPANPVSWRNIGDTLVVTVALSELRPGVPWVSDNDDVVAVSRSLHSEQVQVTWIATVEGGGEQYTGELQVPTASIIGTYELYEMEAGIED